MPIEDVDYLKAKSIKQNYVFLVDSKDRDRSVYPTPSEYLVRFDTPFLNVCGLEVLEATIPRTMYNVDVANNTIRFCIYVDGFSGERTFTTNEVTIGDYSLQTLVPALNQVMKMQVLGHANGVVAGITVAPLSSPPDLRNIIVFTCPYPFILDMQGSTIAETLGFDLFTAPQEATLPEAERRYNALASLPGPQPQPPALYPPPPNHKLFASVDRAWPVLGPNTYVFEGPRGVLRSEPLTEKAWVAQRWTAPYDGFFVGLDAALTTNTRELIDEGVVWALHSARNGVNEPGAVIATGTLAISQVDGGYSDATMPSVAVLVRGGFSYWIVLHNDVGDTRPARVFYNDVIANETTLIRSSNGSDGPWVSVADTTTGIYYHMSARVRIAEAYHRVEAPGVVSMVGERYVTLRCPEIEDNMLRSLSYGRMGLAKMRLGIMGYSENRVDFNKIAVREFHPIGKLSRMLLRFERGDGKLYDFKGVNHTIVFALHYYEPVQKEKFQKSRLNPHYDGNFHEYMYRQDEQEEDSDDQSVDYNEDNETFNQWKAVQQRNLPEQRYLQDIEALKGLHFLEQAIKESEEGEAGESDNGTESAGGSETDTYETDSETEI